MCLFAQTLHEVAAIGDARETVGDGKLGEFFVALAQGIVRRVERVPALAAEWSTTRSAAAVSLWGDRLEGAVVAIGNAPTALFHLLELVAAGGPRPAAVVGVPVGFIGAAESKEALASFGTIPYLVVHGRRGGSAMAASALNALAKEAEL